MEEYLRQAFNQSLKDECNILKFSATQNSLGELVINWIPVYGIPCSLWLTNGIEYRDGEVIKTEADAIIRLPYGTNISAKDRIQITKRFGEATDKVFEVVEEPRENIAGIQVKVKICKV